VIGNVSLDWHHELQLLAPRPVRSVGAPNTTTAAWKDTGQSEYELASSRQLIGRHLAYFLSPDTFRHSDALKTWCTTNRAVRAGDFSLSYPQP